MIENLSDRTIAIFRALSQERADLYAEAFVLSDIRKLLRAGELDADQAAELLEDPLSCLKVVVGHYLFSRRGRERGDLHDAAVAAVAAIFGVQSDLTIWEAFVAACEERGLKPNEANHRSALEGLVSLAAGLQASHGLSLGQWIEESVIKDGRLEECFNALVEIRGIGPKVASTLLRDIVFIFDCSEQIEPIDRIFVLPVDKWAREIAPIVVEEEGVDEMPDWVLAGKLVKYARKAGVDPVRFSMGVAYFGLREVRHPAHFGRLVRQLGVSRVTLH